jgi:hypothetical protein
VRPEDEVRLVLVVAPGDVLDRGQSSLRIRQDVMELQERALRAPVSVLGDESASIAVTLADGALDVPREISRKDDGCSQLSIRPGTDRTRPRLLCRPQLGPLHLLQEQGEGAVEDRARIAAGDLATEKSLNAPELLVALLADRELDAIALRRSGLDDRTS